MATASPTRTTMAAAPASCAASSRSACRRRPFDYTNGDFDLNQGIYTMMSYEDGWETSPYGQATTTDPAIGWLGGLMAFDIAVDPGQIWRQRGMGDRRRHLSSSRTSTRPGTFYECDLGRRRHRQDRLCRRQQRQYRPAGGDAAI